MRQVTLWRWQSYQAKTHHESAKCFHNLQCKVAQCLLAKYKMLCLYICNYRNMFYWETNLFNMYLKSGQTMIHMCHLGCAPNFPPTGSKLSYYSARALHSRAGDLCYGALHNLGHKSLSHYGNYTEVWTELTLHIWIIIASSLVNGGLDTPISGPTVQSSQFTG